MALALRRPANAVRLNEAFQALFAVPGDEPAGTLLGLEHEYRVRSGDQLLDFRSLIHRLPIPGRRIDVADPNAYRCGWGGVITCDGPEAEVAIPPIAQEPNFTSAVVEAGMTGRRQLEAVLPIGTELEGYSTHLSASMPSALSDSAALLYAHVFAPALMLLMDRSESPGLLIRPRPGRIELCGEFTAGPHLRAAAAFVAGSVRACAAALMSEQGADAALPPALKVKLAPAVERFGWFVDRKAFGPDLYVEGRNATLTRVEGGSISGQEHLTAAYEAVRSALVGHASDADLQELEAMVSGRMRLPSEEAAHAEHWLASPPSSDAEAAEPGAWGRAVGTVRRPAFQVSAERLSWDFGVFRVSGTTRSAYASIPRASMDQFLRLLAAGELDLLLQLFLLVSGEGAALENHAMTTSPGLFRTIGSAASLASAERLPFGAVGGPWERPGKRRDDDEDHDDDRRQDNRDESQAQDSASAASSTVTASGRGAATPRPLVLAAVGAVAVVALLVVMAAAGFIPGIGQGAAPMTTAQSTSDPGVGVVPTDESPSPAVNTPVVTATPAATATAAPTPAIATASVVDLSGLEACTLLDQETLQDLTGTSFEFGTGGGDPFGSCFWAATRPVPPYVQLDIDARPDGLQGFVGMPSNWECTGAPVEGVGTEAVGGTCIGSTQTKVYLTVWEGGVRVTLYVNEPEGGLQPEDIGPAIQAILDGILSGQ